VPLRFVQVCGPEQTHAVIRKDKEISNALVGPFTRRPSARVLPARSGLGLTRRSSAATGYAVYDVPLRARGSNIKR
jgi:hypothetical protein